MLIGHNPALQDLALSLAAAGDEALLARLAQKFPTGALAVITLPHPSWRQLGQESGSLKDLVVPRELR
jgi:phosphohistidine phosphatase